MFKAKSMAAVAAAAAATMTKCQMSFVFGVLLIFYLTWRNLMNVHRQTDTAIDPIWLPVAKSINFKSISVAPFWHMVYQNIPFGWCCDFHCYCLFCSVSFRLFFIVFCITQLILNASLSHSQMTISIYSMYTNSNKYIQSVGAFSAHLVCGLFAYWRFAKIPKNQFEK